MKLEGCHIVLVLIYECLNDTKSFICVVAIREDRTRGGRSTYQCSYTLSSAASTSSLLGTGLQSGPLRHASSLTSVLSKYKWSSKYFPLISLIIHLYRWTDHRHICHITRITICIRLRWIPCNYLWVDLLNPEWNLSLEATWIRVIISECHRYCRFVLLIFWLKFLFAILIVQPFQEIMDVEHLWQYNESELTRLNKGQPVGSSTMAPNPANNPLLHAAGVPADASPDFLSNLCNIADHRLYKIVKWCKSLPLFKNISVRISISFVMHIFF